MPKFKPPEHFDFTKPSGWPEWKQRFARYRIADLLDKEPGTVQVNTLLYVMGPQSESIFNSFKFDPAADVNSYDAVVTKFDEYFVPKRNIIYERAQFNLRTQHSGENVESFIRSLYGLIEKCDYVFEQKYKEEIIRDRFVVGITDKTLSEKLQLTPDLTLAKAIEMARQTEQVKQQVKDEGNANENLDEVNRSRRYNVPTSRSFRQRLPWRCPRCGGQHTRAEVCPAWGRTCTKCQKRNHYAVCCRAPTVHEVTTNEQAYSDTEENSVHVDAVTNCVNNCAPWTVALSICRKPISFKLDTGADTTVISEATYNQLPTRPVLQPVTSVLYSPGGALDVKGQFSARTTYKGQKYEFKIVVVGGNQANNLLGRSVCSSMGLVCRVEEIADNVFGNIGKMNCEPVKITLRTDAKPYCVTTPRTIPIPLLPKVEKELEKMERLGVITKITKPTDWCAPMVHVVKPNGQVRICVDLKKLNKSVRRENFRLPTFEDIAPKMKNSTVFSKLDATSGFYQLPLEEKSSEYTTFITPLGRFFFNRVPFGITSAPEIFQRVMTDLLSGLDGVDVIMDDVIVYAPTVQEHDTRLKAVLHRIQESGLKLNREKCVFRKSEIEYFGHIVGVHGIKPNPKRLQAVKDLKPPADVHELRRVVGMINYLGRFIPDLSTIMRPMTDLLKADVAWFWGQYQEEAFEAVKLRLTHTPTLGFYDPHKPTVVSADASSYGLGAAIFQVNNRELIPIAYCSRTLTPAEEKYAQIEKECLAAVYACERFDRYLVGLDSFKLITDHKPLVPLINTQDIDRTPLRCQRLLIRLRRLNPVAEYVAGKQLVVPDTLSRSPLRDTEMNFVEDVQMYVDSLEKNLPFSDRKLEQIQLSTARDSGLQAAIQYTKNGWPDRLNSVSANAQAYFDSRNELSLLHDMLVYRDRVAIPKEMRPEMLSVIHDTGHQGITKCRERAAAGLWWPGINNDIVRKIETCDFCCSHKPAQTREPLMSTQLPSRPWQKISADICAYKNSMYIVVMDYYSRYVDVAFLRVITSEQVILKLKNMFSRFGVPEELVTDNGTQFTSEKFRNFAVKYNFTQIFSSPGYPQSNGEAESAVKIAKRLLAQGDIHLALMAYRSTPVAATGVSPCQLLMGRQIRTNLPTLPQKLEPRWPDFTEVKERDRRAKETSQSYYNRRAKPLPELKPGDRVRIKTDSEKQWTNRGIIQHANYGRRSYVVSTPCGSFTRNRRHLQLVPSDGQQTTVTATRSAHSGDNFPDEWTTPTTLMRENHAARPFTVGPADRRYPIRENRGCPPRRLGINE